MWMLTVKPDSGVGSRVMKQLCREGKVSTVRIDSVGVESALAYLSLTIGSLNQD